MPDNNDSEKIGGFWQKPPGRDAQSAALHTLDAALLSDAQDYAEVMEGVRHGLQDFAEGRFRPFAEFEAEQRAKYNLLAADE